MMRDATAAMIRLKALAFLLAAGVLLLATPGGATPRRHAAGPVAPRQETPTATEVPPSETATPPAMATAEPTATDTATPEPETATAQSTETATPTVTDTATPRPAPSATVDPRGRPIYLPSVRRGDPGLDRVVARTMALAGTGGRMDVWDWEAGVALAGLMYAYEANGDEKILDFVARWTDRRLQAGGGSAGPSPRPPPCRTGAWPADGLAHPNQATPAWAVLMLHHHRPRPEYLAVVERSVAFLAQDACRVDGALAHVPNQLWDDTLIVSVPLLARYGAELGHPEYLDLAVREVLAHARRLQDPATGVWYHGWDANRNDHLSGAFWARGNAWVAVAATELLRWLPPDHPRRGEVVAVLDRQLRGLVVLQARGGLWHTVTTRRDFYLETSGSAGIVAALWRALEAGWIADDALARAAAEAGRRAVQAKVAPDGTVTGVSAGTGVAPAIELYNGISNDKIQPYGQGLYLIMMTAGGGR
jgi:unsaturated rhamnogalacturonyl hydrolase